MKMQLYLVRLLPTKWEGFLFFLDYLAACLLTITTVKGEFRPNYIFLYFTLIDLG